MTAATSSPVARVSILLFERYLGLLRAAPEFGAVPDGCSRMHLMWMCETSIAQSAAWPEDKTSRWLGFVQGVMTAQGLLTVAVVRDISRPLFPAAYAEQGRPCPASVGKTNA